MSARTARRSSGDLQFNMTPLIDIVFQLIIFFMLLSQFAGIERTPVDLPRVSEGRPDMIKPEDKVAVTLKYVENSDQPVFLVGPVTVGSLEDVSSRLAQVKAFSPGVELVVRADKRLEYRHIRGVMQAAGKVGIANVQISVGLE